MTVWRKWSTGLKSHLPPSARPASRGESPLQSLDQVTGHFYPPLVHFQLFVNQETVLMKPLHRAGQPRGYRHRPLGTNYVLDGLCEGSHRGGLFGRVSASRHCRQRSRQPPSHHHRPSQWVGTVSHNTFTLNILRVRYQSPRNFFYISCLYCDLAAVQI